MNISIQEIKNAMKDVKFRASLPIEFKEDIKKYNQNPNCACNLNLYRKILKLARKELQAYYPNEKLEETIPEQLMENSFKVINCHVSELEGKLQELPPGRKQISAARFEDQVTVIINEIDLDQPDPGTIEVTI